ncbi:hypothetical protein T09_11794 [Trichinella sp. T9]|nr:hypothetical protein T09_11794 [Trichinella sp. T9]
MFFQTVAEYFSLESVNECALAHDVKCKGTKVKTVVHNFWYFNPACALY